jgi:hypothetical protein
MIKPRNPEVGVRRSNVQRKSKQQWKLTSDFLMEKYARERRSVLDRLGGYKRP